MFNKEVKSVLDLINAFPDEQACIDHLELLRWNGNVVSPFDPDSKVYDCKGNRYKCRNTGKYFNVKTNTIFDNTKMPLQKWFVAIWLVTSHKKGVSSPQLGRDLGITQKSAWFMLQRIRNCFGLQDNDNSEKLDGIVEIDETYVGGNPSNRKKHIRADKSFDTLDRYRKCTVIGLLQRDGKLVAKHVGNSTEHSLLPVIYGNVDPKAQIYSDSLRAYQKLGRDYSHEMVKHTLGEYVRDEDIHTNGIESAWAILKRGIYGIYHFTSRRHFHFYVDEFVFRFNTRKITEISRFNLFLMNAGNRLTYQRLTHG